MECTKVKLVRVKSYTNNQYFYLGCDIFLQFGYSSLYVGLLFGLKDGANSLTSPLWGWLCDRNRRVKIFILLSSCFAFTSFFLLGPFPGVPINR